MVLQDNLHFINKFKQVVFFQIKSENRNPTKCEIETYDETYDRLVTSKLQTTQMQGHPASCCGSSSEQ